MAFLIQPQPPGGWHPVSDVKIDFGISLALLRILLTKGGTGAGPEASIYLGWGYRKGHQNFKEPFIDPH